ncbi:MAG TPA: GAF domain-containing protein [Candidatus Baltobacteraceae bacterium]|jgi:hypothetical protein|nr:GAF domain-containing protein [Candidatus Baltobacteraceae bacterium]
MNRPIVGYILAFLAIAMLCLVFGEALAPLAHTTFGVRIVPSGNRAAVGRILPDSAAYEAGVRVGDQIDVMSMTIGGRMRLRTSASPIGTQIAVPIVRNGQRRFVTFVSGPRPTGSVFASWQFLLSALVTLLIVAVIAWRKPSTATAALVLYGMGACTTAGIVAQFSWLSEPWYTIVGVFIISAFSTLPIAALLPFIVRFPYPPVTREARIRMHVADGLFWATAILCLIETLYEPVLYVSWFAFDMAVTMGLMAIVLIFAVLVYRDATGEERRRIGWVMAGLIVSAAGYTAFNIIDTYIVSGWTAPPGVVAATQLLQCALPLALAYAVLRHRVLDIGFALNRTMVYGAITALVVAVVSLVDWLSSRVISEQRWALALEAVITIGFGFALNFIHGKTERLIDRIVFRARHLAEKRIEYRIGALGFSSSAAAVDEAVADDAPRILDLSSAAVFGRLAEKEPFTRKASFGWSGESTVSVADDSLLVRTLRSLERPIVLDDVAIVLDSAPSGAARPAIAIPIVTQHELIGFALFGNRRDGALPDPEEIGLLAKLCAAAGNAYGAVEARQWRERAATLERSLANLMPANQPN